MDIRNFPYFHYNDLIDQILDPLKSQVAIEFLGFKRCYPNREQFHVSIQMLHWADYYSREFYRLGYFEKDTKYYESASYMWDHLPFDSSRQVYQFMREHHGYAHGLTITQQHGTHCDYFVFATHPNNSVINHFYLNKKELFVVFMQDFYKRTNQIIQDLSQHHKFLLPGNMSKNKNAFEMFSPRQRECGTLLVEGLTTKQIAKNLKLSHRTVEDYINQLKIKCGAKNRAQLTYVLRQCL